MLFCFVKKKNSDTRYNMDESQKHANCKKPVTKGEGLYDFTYMRCLEQPNSQEAEWGFPGTRQER